jgi:hypothetical protein
MPIKISPFGIGGDWVATPDDVRAVENKLSQYYKARDAAASIQKINEEISSQKSGLETNRKDINDLKNSAIQLSEKAENYVNEFETFREKVEASLQKIGSAQFATEIKAVFEGQMERFRKSGKETLQAFEQAETTKRELEELLKSTTELIGPKSKGLLAQLDISWKKILSDLESKREVHQKLSDEIHQTSERVLSKLEEQANALSKLFSDAKLGIQSTAASETSSITAHVNEANLRLDGRLTDACAALDNIFQSVHAIAEEHKQRIDASDLVAAEVFNFRETLHEFVDSKKKELLAQLDISWRKILSDLDSKEEAHKKLSDEIQTAAERALIKFEEQADSLSKLCSDAKLGIQSAAASETLSISALVNEANVRLEKNLTDASSELDRMLKNAEALTEDHKQRMDASDLVAAEVFDFRKLLPEKDKVILRQQEQLVQLSAELAETQSQLRKIQAIAESCVPDSARISERLKWLIFGMKPDDRKVALGDGQK